MRTRGGRIPHGRVGPSTLRSASVLLKLLLFVAGSYAAIALAVWLVQDRLIFYPQAPGNRPSPPRDWRLEEVSFRTHDGTQLAGVLVLPPVERPPAVVYFGGNAEEVTTYAPLAAENYGRRAVLLVNYRGYGGSGGSPSEKALVADGIELVDWLRSRPDIDSQRMAIHGRSLGSGVAVQVAAARPPRCIVLTSPFASARDLAAEMYWWLPVAFLLRHPFDSVALAPKLSIPALVLIGGADTLIAPSHSKRLAQAWGTPAETVVLEGFGHNDIDMSPRYAESIRSFLDRRL